MNQFERFPKFCLHSSAWSGVRYFCFRFFGYGLHFRWTPSGYTPLFSERYGHEKVIKIGRLWIKGLKP